MSDFDHEVDFFLEGAERHMDPTSFVSFRLLCSRIKSGDEDVTNIVSALGLAIHRKIDNSRATGEFLTRLGDGFRAAGAR
jgi:hypothetical protein